MPQLYALWAAIAWDNVLSGLGGAIIGGLIGGWSAGRYVIWQTREAARHDLRAIVVRMGVHAQQCKGIKGGDGQFHRTDPWSVYMEDAIAAYLRYRALLLPWQRSGLDTAWTAFQGTKPAGDTPYAYVPMCDNIQGAVNRSLQFLKTIE